MSIRSLAKEHKVSHTTIQRNWRFGRAVNIIAAAVGEQPLALLNGELRLGKRQWQLLAQIATESSAQAAKDVLGRARTAKTMKEANAMVRAAYEELIGPDWEQEARETLEHERLVDAYVLIKLDEIPARRKTMEPEALLDWIEEQLRYRPRHGNGPEASAD